MASRNLSLLQWLKLCLAAAICLVQGLESAAAAGGQAGREGTEFCSRKCITKDCDSPSLSLRYGKFCGVGHTGCQGEEPCDPLDACCRGHDDCVTKYGVLSVMCHEKFKKCMKKVKKTGKPGFSKVCPYDVVIPAMTQGMDLAIMLGQSFSGKSEL